MKKRSMLFGVMAAGILMLVIVFGTSIVIAKTYNSMSQSPKPVSSSDQEQRNNDADHYEEMKTRCEQQIDSAAATGKITLEQKKAILDKEAELHQDMAELRDLSPEKREEAMVKMMSEMRSWAEDNGIELKDFMGHGNGHMSMGDSCSPEMMRDMDSMMPGAESMM